MIVAAGLFDAPLPIDAVPDLTSNEVLVLSKRQLSPLEIERTFTSRWKRP